MKFMEYSESLDIESEIKKILDSFDGSFYICDLSDVERKFKDWIKFLPRVTPCYAVKCNDDINVLKLLVSLGCGFDCASLLEIEKIIALNVDPQSIIFAHPLKIPSHIEYAKKIGPRFMTYDTEDELFKIQKIYPDANLVLRIKYSSDKAVYDLGTKFGACPGDEAENLLKLAKSLNLNVIGISFHIGSICEDYATLNEAMKASRCLFEFGKKVGYDFEILDIGGGFLGDNFSRISEFAGPINDALDEHFPKENFPLLEVLSEPGRYFVTSAFTLISPIHSRRILRDINHSIVKVMYYLNEGVYSNFLFLKFGLETANPKVLAEKKSSVKYLTTIWGPTCDCGDQICENIQLELLEIGDVLYFTNMGAYTTTCKTFFNSFEETKIFYFVKKN